MYSFGVIHYFRYPGRFATTTALTHLLRPRAQGTPQMMRKQMSRTLYLLYILFSNDLFFDPLEMVQFSGCPTYCVSNSACPY